MANTNRRYINRSGQMFIPMNVEGGVWQESFFSSNKVVALVVMSVIDFIVILWMAQLDSGWVLKLILSFILAYVNLLVIRLIVFEEKYFYKMYLKMKDNGVTTPGIFWDIANIKDTDDGATILYSDMRVGVILRVERDTITGKAKDFKETHFDAISDFYKELNIKRYKFVQMNIMEQAGKDPRLQKLDELSVKCDNRNIAKIVEMQIGNIKSITRATLFESDYFLIYTDELSKSESILTDVIDSVYKLLDGGFISFRILSSKEILDMVKELYGVKYFDYTEATLGMFRNNGMNIGKSFNIKEIQFTNGDSENISNIEINRLNILASYIIKNDIKYGDWTIRDALKGKIKNGTNNMGNMGTAASTNDAIGNNSESPAYSDLDNFAFGVSSNMEMRQDNEKINKKSNRTKGIQARNTMKKKDNNTQKENQQVKENKKVNDENVEQEEEYVDF